MSFDQGHALLIGVGSHQYEKRLDVPITVADAQAVAGILRELFYYSGHGEYGEDGNYYLVSHDARLSNRKVVAGSGVSQGELLEKMARIPAKTRFDGLQRLPFRRNLAHIRAGR